MRLRFEACFRDTFDRVLRSCGHRHMDRLSAEKCKNRHTHTYNDVRVIEE